MNRSTGVLLGGIGLGVGAYLLLRILARPRRMADIHVTTQDLDYQDLSPRQLVSDHLVDLNAAEGAQLQELGLDAQSSERLIENRPYRNKLELISRMILTEQAYASIRDKVGVSEGRAPVKIA